MATTTKPPFLINAAESAYVFLRSQAFRFVTPKYFHNDPQSYEPKPFADILGAMTIELENGETKWTLTTEYEGEKRVTTILVMSGFDPAKPTLIYHHGASDTKPLNDFYRVFGKEFPQGYNTFVIHAQHHSSKRDYLNHSVDSFLHHQQTFAGSVLAVEQITQYHRARSTSQVIVTGVSMGGIVSSLHAFNYGSADYYFPMVAYPNVGEIFLGKAYQTVVKNWDTKRQQPTYFNSFAISDFDPLLVSKVFPILGETDRIVPFDKAYSFWNDKGFTVKTFPYGHFTPGIVGQDIRDYMTSRMTTQTQ